MSEQEKDEWKAAEIDRFLKSTEWRRAQDGKGRTYYYRKATNSTQWQKPDELVEFEKGLDLRCKAHFEPEESATNDMNKNSRMENPPTAQIQIAPVKISSLSNKAQKLRASNPFGISADSESDMETEDVSNNLPSQGESALDSLTEEERLYASLSVKDSIMDPKILLNAKTLIQQYKRNPKDIISVLTGSYSGYALLSKILLEWLHFSSNILEQKSETSNAEGTNVNKFFELLSSLIETRFNKKLVDDLFSKSEPFPDWLTKALHTDKFRSLIQKLHSKFPDSRFLSRCMEEMKTENHNDSDDFRIESLSTFKSKILVDCVNAFVQATVPNDYDIYISLSQLSPTVKNSCRLYTNEIAQQILEIKNKDLSSNDEPSRKRQRTSIESVDNFLQLLKAKFIHDLKPSVIITQSEEMRTILDEFQIFSSEFFVELSSNTVFRWTDNNFLKRMLVLECCQINDKKIIHYLDQSLVLLFGSNLFLSEENRSFPGLQFPPVFLLASNFTRIVFQNFSEIFGSFSENGAISWMNVKRFFSEETRILSIFEKSFDTQVTLFWQFFKLVSELTVQGSLSEEKSLLLRNFFRPLDQNQLPEGISKIYSFIFLRSLYFQSLHLETQFLTPKLLSESIIFSSENFESRVSHCLQFVNDIQETHSALSSEIFECVEAINSVLSTRPVQSLLVNNAKKEIATILLQFIKREELLTRAITSLTDTSAFDSATLRYILSFLIDKVEAKTWEMHSTELAAIFLTPSAHKVLLSADFPKDILEKLRWLVLQLDSNSSDSVSGLRNLLNSVN